MPDWNEKKLGNGQTEENSEGVKDYVWQRQKTIPLCDKGATHSTVPLPRSNPAMEPEGSSRRLSKYEYTTRMK